MPRLLLLLACAALGACATQPDYRAAWAAYQRPPHATGHATVIGLHPAGEGRLYVTAQIGGAPRRLMVDTGAATSLIVDARFVGSLDRSRRGHDCTLDSATTGAGRDRRTPAIMSIVQS